MIEAHVYRDGRPVDGPIELAACRAALTDPQAFVWLDAADPTEEELADIAGALGLHPLTLEDALHRGQRPKAELFDDYAYVVLRPFVEGADGPLEWDIREIHALVAPRYLATIRFGPEPFPIDAARKRWEGHPDLLASDGGSFALWALADHVVDGYLVVVEALEEAADLLEDDVFDDVTEESDADLQQRLFRRKRDAARLRRLAAPLRPALDLLQEDERLVGPTMLPYYRDVTEHILRAADLADNVRDLLTSLLEVRVAQVSNRMNEVMKKLSAWAGIILVPTLIAGIYGMNFRHMPELSWGVGYPLAIGTMAVSAVILYAVFKSKDWL
jgi:magnesium transporter